jgi:hypothetical protein
VNNRFTGPVRMCADHHAEHCHGLPIGAAIRRIYPEAPKREIKITGLKQSDIIDCNLCVICYRQVM